MRRLRPDHGFFVPLVLAALCGATACAEKETPVGTLAVAPDRATLPYPGFLQLDFTMQMSETLGSDERPLVFVHLLDGPGSVVRTFDHEFPQDWRPGGEASYAVTLLQSALAPPLAPGRYAMTVGLYRGERRWPLAVQGRQTDTHEYQVAEVTVPEEEPRAPMFNFSPSWMPTEGGTDAQVLGRRWLSSAGVLRLAEIPGPGTLRLGLRLPPPKEGEEDLVFVEGRSAPGAHIVSGCGGQEISISGFGPHVVEIPVEAAEGGGMPASCELRFEPFSQLVEKRSLQTRALLLEALSWRSAERGS